jgi:hypothetical protein
MTYLDGWVGEWGKEMKNVTYVLKMLPHTVT